MRKGLFIFSVMALVLTTGVAQADDKEDVIAAVDAVIAAWNAGDVDAIQKYYAPDFTRFGQGGDLLRVAWDWADLKESFESGLKVALSPPRHTEVRVYGNTAVYTGYTRLTLTLPEGAPRTTTRRGTSVLVKQGGQWKSVHFHASRLTPPQPE